MWDKLKKVWLRIHYWVAVIVALLGFAYVLSQTLAFAEFLPTTPQEGEISWIGSQFANGSYQPYEQNSPWMRYMPLAYLVPGYVQNFSEPGLAAGRMYAVVVGALAVIGIWLAVRRNASLWWAAFAVLVIALNPAYLQAFSQVSTQALVSMLFAWMLVFGLGAERQDWELALAAFFAGLAGITQFNLMLVLPVFVFYVFWQFDKRAGWMALIAGLLPLALMHVLYWPGILQVWANILPADLFSWVETYRSPQIGTYLPESFQWTPVADWLRNPQHLAWVGIRALGEAVRVHFVVFFGTLTTLLLWPWLRKNRPGGRSITKVFFNQHKQVVFLLLSFLVLFLAQAWAANGRICQFTCLPGSLLGIYVFGLVLLPVSAAGWREEMPFWKQILIVIVIFLVLIALEYNFASDYQAFRSDFVRSTLDLKVPAWQDGKLVAGTQQLGQFLEEKTSFQNATVRKFILRNDLAVTLVRWIKVIGFLIVVTPLAYWISEKYTLGPENYGAFMLTFTLLYGLVFSGSHFYGASLAEQACSVPLLESYQKVGDKLRAQIPAGSQLYWGVEDAMLLFYLPEVQVEPAQWNGSATFLGSKAAETERLASFGWWNREMKNQWIEEADFVLVEKTAYLSSWEDRVEAGQFKLVLTTPPTATCRGDLARIVLLAPAP